MGPEDWIQAIRFGSKSLYPLSGLARPLFAFQVLRLHVWMFEPFCPALTTTKKSHKAFQWRVNECKLPSILCKGMWWSHSWKQKGFKFYINTSIIMYFPCLPLMPIYFIRPKHSDEVTWTGWDIFLPRGTARSFQLLTKCGSTHRLPFGIGGREWVHLDIPKHPTKKVGLRCCLLSPSSKRSHSTNVLTLPISPLPLSLYYTVVFWENNLIIWNQFLKPAKSLGKGVNP